MDGFNPILLGVTLLLAGAAIGGMLILSRENRAAFVYGQLALMVGIYVGFAIIELDSAAFVSRAALSALIIESITALAFLGAGLGVLASDKKWLLGVLILGHGGVDLGHLLINSPHSPAWYEFLCVVYDGVVGVAAIWLLSDHPQTSHSEATQTEAVQPGPS